jgi:hypothetical protein
MEHQGAMLSDLAVDAEQGLSPCSLNPTSKMIDGLRSRILTNPRRLDPSFLSGSNSQEDGKNVADLA